MNHFIMKSYIGEDTEVHIDFTYYPADPPVLDPIERAHPGSDERVELNQVWINHDSSKIDDLLPDLTQEVTDRLAQEALRFAEQEAQA